MTTPRIAKVYPLPLLPDLRRPYITSSGHWRNPSRNGKPGPDGKPTKRHDGCDFFYRWRIKDGNVRLGDGGAARDWSKPGAPPKWFIPEGVTAIAAAPGIVLSARPAPTGHHVWI